MDVAGETGSVAVVPVGAVEQHGRHLPTGTDSLLVATVVQESCERASADVPVLFTPPLWCGLSEMHRGFGGQLSLGVRTMLAVLEDVGQAALDCGFDAVLFVNGHGGNSSVIGTAVASLGRAHSDAEVLALPYASLAADIVDDVRESDAGGMYHAGEFETSLMLALYADLVGEDAEGVHLDEPYDLRTSEIFEGGALSVYRQFDRYSESGAVGDPDLGSAESGDRLFDRVCDELAALIETIHEENASRT